MIAVDSRRYGHHAYYLKVFRAQRRKARAITAGSFGAALSLAVSAIWLMTNPMWTHVPVLLSAAACAWDGWKAWKLVERITVDIRDLEAGR